MELLPLCFKPPSTTPCAASSPMKALLNVKFPVLMLLSAILTLQLQSVSYLILQIEGVQVRHRIIATVAMPPS